MEELREKRVLVLGLGRSGQSAARFCAGRGARVTAADEHALPAEVIQYLEQLDGLEGFIELHLGKPFPDPAGFDIVVPSPGVPASKYTPRAKHAWGDIELAFRTCQPKIIAITGSNGKSTTTRLVEAMLCQGGQRARAAGNIGTPILELTEEKLDRLVLEVSSFQLEAVESFRPEIAVLLNLSPDHIDRHGTQEAYYATKARIFANQQAGDLLIANAADETVMKRIQSARSRLWTFHPSEPQERGAWIEGDRIALRVGEKTQHLPFFSLGALEGVHHRENALAALLAAVAAGVRAEDALSALAKFQGLPHRTEFVRTVNGVRYIDDSKATNVGAAVQSLQSFDAPIVWIAGGRNKGLDYTPLTPATKSVRAAVLLGESAAQLEAILPASIPRKQVSSMVEAVTEAARRARRGDVVLLSPACASFDLFNDFKDRGQAFKLAVSALAKANGEPVPS